MVIENRTMVLAVVEYGGEWWERLRSNTWELSGLMDIFHVLTWGWVALVYIFVKTDQTLS